MNAPQSSTLDAVKDVIVTALGISERADQIDADTALFGSMPELDSFAVVEIAAPEVSPEVLYGADPG